MKQIGLLAELEDEAEVKRIKECLHEGGFHTDAYVPGGVFCTECDKVIVRDMPPLIDEPFLIGYVTANWAYKYQHGNDWCNDQEG